MKWLALVALPLVLAACALVYEGRYDYDAGWRKATVLAQGGASDINQKAAIDCRDPSPTADMRQFVYVRYNHVPYYFHRGIVAVPEGWQLSIGERLYVNILDCKEPIVRARIDW